MKSDFFFKNLPSGVPGEVLSPWHKTALQKPKATAMPHLHELAAVMESLT